MGDKSKKGKKKGWKYHMNFFYFVADELMASIKYPETIQIQRSIGQKCSGRNKKTWSVSCADDSNPTTQRLKGFPRQTRIYLLHIERSTGTNVSSTRKYLFLIFDEADSRHQFTSIRPNDDTLPHSNHNEMCPITFKLFGMASLSASPCLSVREFSET